MYIYIYNIYIYMCVCVCVCVCKKIIKIIKKFIKNVTFKF